MTVSSGMKYWTNPSVARFAGDIDPVAFMQKKARELIFHAFQKGWTGLWVQRSLDYFRSWIIV